MTITEARPEASATTESEAPAEQAGRPALPDFILDSADHKRVGLVFISFSLLFLLAGGAVGAAMRAELWAPGVQVVGGQYGRLFAAHVQLAAVLFLGPFWVGLATYIVPLQIGATRLAFPRIQALAAWMFVIGGGLNVLSYLMGPVPGLGLADGTPLQAPPGGVNHATDLWVTSLALVAVAMLLATGNIVVTCLTLRVKGMTLIRMPLFTWSALSYATVMLFASAAHLAGLLLLYLDLHLGGASLMTAPGGRLIWDHLLWLYGRPDVVLLTLPALGVACEIVTTAARRPLMLHGVGAGLLAGYAGLSLTSYYNARQATGSIFLPLPTIASVAVGAPLGLLLLLWMATIWKGRIRFTASLPFVVAALLCWGFGALMILIAIIVKVHGDAFATGNVHVIAFGPPTILAFAALVHWSPKFFGRKLFAPLAFLSMLGMLGGVVLAGLGSYVAGFQGQGNHFKEAVLTGTQNASRAAMFGEVTLGLSAGLLLLEIARTVAVTAGIIGKQKGKGPNDPYEGLTLEWAAESPPAVDDFDDVPEVRSEAPMADYRDAQNQPSSATALEKAGKGDG